VIRLPLETERLVIRPFEPEVDAAPLHELRYSISRPG